MSRRHRSRLSRATSAEAYDLDELGCFDEDGRIRPLCLICHQYVYPGETIIQMQRMEVSRGGKSGCTNYEQVFYPDGDDEKIIHEACFAAELGFLMRKLEDEPGARDI